MSISLRIDSSTSRLITETARQSEGVTEDPGRTLNLADQRLAAYVMRKVHISNYTGAVATDEPLGPQTRSALPGRGGIKHPAPSTVRQKLCRAAMERELASTALAFQVILDGPPTPRADDRRDQLTAPKRRTPGLGLKMEAAYFAPKG